MRTDCRHTLDLPFVLSVTSSEVFSSIHLASPSLSIAPVLFRVCRGITTLHSPPQPNCVGVGSVADLGADLGAPPSSMRPLRSPNVLKPHGGYFFWPSILCHYPATQKGQQPVTLVRQFLSSCRDDMRTDCRHTLDLQCVYFAEGQQLVFRLRLGRAKGSASVQLMRRSTSSESCDALLPTSLLLCIES